MGPVTSHVPEIPLSKIPHAHMLQWDDMTIKKVISFSLGPRPYRSSRIDDEVVQDKRQRDDNDLQDERQDQPKEEEVEPRRCKRARTEKLFGPDFVSFMVENEPTSYREV
ncbi:hypothetical protein Tco_0463052, partial [Tanacetum coccineum]